MVTIQMFLSRSRSLKIKKKLFDKMKHAFRTSYNNLASRSRPYWSLNFTDCAIENTPSFFNTSAKMNFASSDCSATISMSNNLSWLYFFTLSFKKDDIQREISKLFCWIINRHKWNGDYTHQLICFFWFSVDVGKHCPYYIKSTFIVSRRLF